MTRVIAHRGASGSEPENTPAAFEAAIQMHSDMIEFDVHQTRDGALVVVHDDEFPGLGPIQENLLCDLRSHFQEQGKSIALLDEVLDRFGSRIQMNVELKKATEGLYPGMEMAVVDAVSRRGLLSQALFSSFSGTVLKRIRDLSAQARIGVLDNPRRRSPKPISALFERARSLSAESVHTPRQATDPHMVSGAQGAGFLIHVFTVDRREEMERLLALGVDGIFTNYPDRLRKLLPNPDPEGS